MKFGKLFVVALGCLVLVPAAALAQSSMAGQVTDNTGGVLPGVTVEAASPALIEGARVVVTGGTGQYNVIDLRPGTYSLTFTLPGFGTQVRDELVLIAEQAMTIDVAMSVGAVEESVTVSGESPVVDVQQVQRVEVLSREVQEAIPTGRSIWSYAQLVPGVRLSKPDVGGLSGHQQATISGPGAQRRDTVMEIDGQDVSMYIGDTWMPYLNPMLTAETSYTTTGIGAETQRGGLRINMVPKEGGNQFSGSFFVGGSPTGAWQSSNWTQRLGDLGIQSIQAGDERDGIPHLDRGLRPQHGDGRPDHPGSAVVSRVGAAQHRQQPGAQQLQARREPRARHEQLDERLRAADLSDHSAEQALGRVRQAAEAAVHPARRGGRRGDGGEFLDFPPLRHRHGEVDLDGE